ncbi:MAG TPA: hypothetical protein VMA73_13750 [Streptosporangiaceae bacterium]|nr:hypothetical protein [Streptosporangiaceae bacterium]
MNDTVTCLVRGPASRYPRGFLWLIPAWFIIVSAVVLAVVTHASGRMPLWLGLPEIGGLALAAVTMFGVLATVRHYAFRADSHGIVLGVATNRKRPKLRQIYVPWQDIAQVRMVRRHYGLLLDISLVPSAPVAHRQGLGRQALVLLGTLIMPFGFGRGTPALTMPRSNPPRYRVKICDVSPAELQQALATVQPAGPPLRVLVKKGALRFTLSPARQSLSQQPPTPVA